MKDRICNYGMRVNRLSLVSHVVTKCCRYMRWWKSHQCDFYMLWSGVLVVVSPKHMAVNTTLKMWFLWQHLCCCDSAKSQLVNSSLPAFRSHRHWLHVYLNEAPQWLWKHTVMVGYTLSTNQLCCVKDHSPVMMLNHRCCLSCTVTLWERYCGCFPKSHFK